jgi:hypothetical protein
VRRKGNLSEQLFKMRKLMNFNSEKFRDNVTSYDQLLESEIINRYLIKEQGEQDDQKKTTDVVEVGTGEILCPDDNERKLFGYLLTQNAPPTITPRQCRLYCGGKKEKPKNYLCTNDLPSKYPIYYSFLRSIKNSEKTDDDTFIKIWYTYLDTASREYFLNEYGKYVREVIKNDRHYKKFLSGKETYGIKANLSTKKTSEDVATSEGKVSNQPITFENTVRKDDAFVDNKVEIPQRLNSDIDNFIKDITPMVEKAKSEGTKVSCTKIIITSSSSRFRNTEEAEDKTWKQLSHERSEKIYEKVKGELEKLGVDFESDHKIFVYGTNGDGTSGPNPGKNEKGVQYEISKDGSYNNKYNRNELTDDVVKAKGDPHATKEEYDQYKFATLDVELVGLNKVKIDPEFKTVTKNGYYLNMNIKEEVKINWFFKQLSADFNHMKLKSSAKSRGKTYDMSGGQSEGRTEFEANCVNQGKGTGVKVD